MIYKIIAAILLAGVAIAAAALVTTAFYLLYRLPQQETIDQQLQRIARHQGWDESGTITPSTIVFRSVSEAEPEIREPEPAHFENTTATVV